jgi:hypothetical protein
MSRRAKTTVGVAIVALALIATLVSGCSMDRWAEVEPGEYKILYGGANNMAAAREIQSLEIDRDQHLMVLTLVDGSQVVASFVPRDRSEWPAGCPSNIQSTRMEVLDIEQDPLVIGSATLNDPILVRDCPPDPGRVVLRQDGAIGGSFTACPHPEPCIYFAP